MRSPPLEVFLATIGPNKPGYYSSDKGAFEVRREGGIFDGVGFVVAMTVRLPTIATIWLVELRLQTLRPHWTQILTGEDEHRRQEGDRYLREIGFHSFLHRRGHTVFGARHLRVAPRPRLPRPEPSRSFSLSYRRILGGSRYTAATRVSPRRMNSH